MQDFFHRHIGFLKRWKKLIWKFPPHKVFTIWQKTTKYFKSDCWHLDFTIPFQGYSISGTYYDSSPVDLQKTYPSFFHPSYPTWFPNWRSLNLTPWTTSQMIGNTPKKVTNGRTWNQKCMYNLRASLKVGSVANRPSPNWEYIPLIYHLY